MIQIADITGIYGVSFLVVAVNGAFADIFLIKKRTEDMPLFPLSHTIIGAGVLCLVILSTIVYGQIRLKQERPGKYMTVSIAQGNIEQDKKWNHQYQDTVLEIYKELSLRAKSFHPSLIVWPETALPFHFGTDDIYTKELIDFQKQLNTYLLFGSVLVKEQSDERYLMSNSAVLLDTDGNTVYSYDKIHLVPFGEYVPLRNLLFFIDKMVVGIGDYIPGERHTLAPFPLGGFAPLICYEVIFPGLVRKFFANGGDFIVNITNDAWFGKTSGPYQHFSMAVLRAVENRKPVIRAANTGISGFIDSNGRILSRSDLFQRELLVMKIRTDSTRSFYARYGDLFSYIWIVFSIILITNIFGKSTYM
jgi:apolipoprotein N-acyltransferase